MSKIRFPHHRLNCQAQVGSLEVSANIELSAPWTVLFGPSGSGKSTLLRAACGLLNCGTINFQHRASPRAPIDTSDLPAADAMAFSPLDRLPTHQRNLAYAPQGAVLFPHLTVRENIAFASSVRGPGCAPLVDTLIELFGLRSLVQRYPRSLSGGERQRVAMARAFAVPSPNLILLDEPFAGLDRRLRDELLPKIATYAAGQGIPVLSVTHDVEEAFLVDAEIIRIDSGRMIARGPASMILAKERAQILQLLGSKS